MSNSEEKLSPENVQPIVLIDGECNLCNNTVKFVLAHEKDQTLNFASLQSEEGKEILSHFNSESGMDSVVLIEQGELYTRSNAALRIARYLHFPWSVLQYAKVFPRALRDAVYRFISRNRYKWFGTQEEVCGLIPPDQRQRFIDL